MSGGRQRFSIIPAMAVTDTRLEPRDLQVLCLLGRHTDDLGWCCRSQVKMARELNCGRATVQRALGRLAEAGYLEHRPKQRTSGADAAHDYRVVIDPPEAPAAAEIDPQGVPIHGQGCPPMDGQGVPTHERAPRLTTPVKQVEREARAGGQEAGSGGAAETEDPKRIEAEGWALLKNWPGFDGMPKKPALALWMAMGAEDRASARRRFPAWRELIRKQKKSHVPAPSTYLAERLWEAVPDPADAPPPPTVAAPFGKVWGAIRMVDLVDGPGPIPSPRGFVAQLIGQGGEMGERERLRHQAAHGWPTVRRMDEAAASRRGWTARLDDGRPERLAATFEPVRVGGEAWAAWQALFERRGWPWLPDPGRQEWVYFPAGGPERIGEFEIAVRGNQDDAGGCEAAE